MTITSSLDMYGLLVESLFGGSILFSIICLVVLLALLGMMSRMSLYLMSYIIILFLISMLVGFFGSLAGIIIFAFSAIYFFMAIIPWIRGT